MCIMAFDISGTPALSMQYILKSKFVFMSKIDTHPR